MTDALGDLDRIEALLKNAARAQHAVSYSEMLAALGHRFTRPKMRALCKSLDAIDAKAAAADEPELAVLVVRESDRLPGQGWWVGRCDYHGKWTGSDAHHYVESVQAAAFRFWGRHVAHKMPLD